MDKAKAKLPSDVCKLIKIGNKIVAIRRIRELYNVNLPKALEVYNDYKKTLPASSKKWLKPKEVDTPGFYLFIRTDDFDGEFNREILVMEVTKGAFDEFVFYDEARIVLEYLDEECRFYGPLPAVE